MIVWWTKRCFSQERKITKHSQFFYWVTSAVDVLSTLTRSIELRSNETNCECSKSTHKWMHTLPDTHTNTWDTFGFTGIINTESPYFMHKKIEIKKYRHTNTLYTKQKRKIVYLLTGVHDTVSRVRVNSSIGTSSNMNERSHAHVRTHTAHSYKLCMHQWAE